MSPSTLGGKLATLCPYAGNDPTQVAWHLSLSHSTLKHCADQVLKHRADSWPSGVFGAVTVMSVYLSCLMIVCYMNTTDLCVFSHLAQLFTLTQGYTDSILEAKVKVTMTPNCVRTIFQECIEGFFSNQTQTYNWLKSELIRFWMLRSVQYLRLRWPWSIFLLLRSFTFFKAEAYNLQVVVLIHSHYFAASVSPMFPWDYGEWTSDP